jgi:hypothetical protein
VRFQVLTKASMKFRVFWDVAPCIHVEVDQLQRDDLTSLVFLFKEIRLSFNPFLLSI